MVLKVTCPCNLEDQDHFYKLYSFLCRGEEFRPAFKKLGNLVCVFEKAIHLLLTATVTQKSILTLTKQINLKNPVVITKNVDRPNISLEIRATLPNIKKN